ncbi:hypothetical protein ESCO_005989 [Escovopsis weberi]|uniref:Uncharacterized protein n=1 Tax=Escovopsis weberi TaxID=150374 RepID=A0A0M8MQ82_ESCWE|nr:hypothetical protein ESCO_005989 [Escovopsis weberi]
MAPTRIGPLAQAWYKWKALRLPWRKRFLVGFDLEGNTYWEFRLTSRGGGGGGGDNENPNPSGSGSGSGEERWRRIVQYPRSTHYSEIKVPPQWHSWLRHTRRDPPPLAEQAAEVARQARIKELAAAADRRWDAKPRVMDPQPAAGAALAAPEPPLKTTAAGARDEGRPHKETGHNEAEDPWERARRRGLGEGWQPTAWSPGATKGRS